LTARVSSVYMRTGAAVSLSLTRSLITMSSVSRRLFVLDPFVLKQFDDPNYTGTHIDFEKEAFEERINELHEAGTPLVDGYAPFCKHLFVPNFTPARIAYLAITRENEGKLRSGYEARTEQELPVLTRWFPAGTEPPPVASYLDIILYSREQIRKEAMAMGRADELEEDAPWGIISVKAQMVDFELPMQPITMMRNALGVEEGGSGIALDREKYAASVKFWAENAPLK